MIKNSKGASVIIFIEAFLLFLPIGILGDIVFDVTFNGKYIGLAGLEFLPTIITYLITVGIIYIFMVRKSILLNNKLTILHIVLTTLSVVLFIYLMSQSIRPFPKQVYYTSYSDPYEVTVLGAAIVLFFIIGQITFFINLFRKSNNA